MQHDRLGPRDRKLQAQALDLMSQPVELSMIGRPGHDGLRRLRAGSVLIRCGRQRFAAAMERIEQAQRPFDHRHVLPAHLAHAGRKKRGEGLLHRLPQLRLLPGKTGHRGLEIRRHDPMQAATVEADQLPQERGRQHGSAFALFLDDDLRQHAARDVLRRFRVVHNEIPARADHVGQIVERDVARRFGVIQPAVGVFFYHHRRLRDR